MAAGGLMSAGQVTAASAAADFKWLCKPGKADDPCRISLKQTALTENGEGAVTTPRRQAKPKVDCFYVYPTVSGQQTANAELSRDPELDGIAIQQAAQFSRICRVFAPIYPQFTVASILSGTISPDSIATAYAGVKAAWREYLRRYNRGRGIVLIGHSQGTGHLARLIEETIDGKPRLCKRLVSAVLIGGNVYVPKGKRVGGQFSNVPACSRAKQTGCAIAYSGFLDPPPADANFARVTGALVTLCLDPAEYEVMCVNPARLDGSRGQLKGLYNTESFPGIYGPLLPQFTGATTPWVSYPDHYTASCERSEGAHWLQVTDVSPEGDERPKLTQPLGPTWGTHLTEVNDAAGNLVKVVRTQSSAYLKKVRLAKKKSRRKAR